ncbi:unnamed protein product [Symbiodinium natans]|uniref:Methyltransferase FkbM domain-containing protein n=1 Tax=Symbiodinium natans TaxID=878477 RepID=A0A812PI27_9DINO|nr:unnamed protein product [Symbiodinium natans]
MVELFVNGNRTLGPAPLSDYRFEGYVHPEAYRDSSGRIFSLSSPWAENVEDIARSLALFNANRSLRRGVEQRKARRFRLGRRPAAPRTGTASRQLGTNISVFLEQLVAAGVALEGSFVNIGANEGIADDPLSHFAQSRLVKESGTAVAIEADEGFCAQHRKNLPWVTLHCGFAVPATLKALLGRLTWRSLDVLKVDIDSYDGSWTSASTVWAGARRWCRSR